MAYLIGQIWVLIVAAAAIGLVLGWLLSEAFRDGRRPAQADDVQARLDRALAEAEASAIRESELASAVRRLTDDKTSLENQLSMLGTRLREAQARAEHVAAEDGAASEDGAAGKEPSDPAGTGTDPGAPAPEAHNRPAQAPPAG